MRILSALIVVSGIALPVSAQTAVESFVLLQDVLRTGETVVVTDDAGRETEGILMEVSASLLTLAPNKRRLSGSDVARRIFAEDAVRTVRRTDPLGNGTLAGLGVGLAATGAFAARCGKYRFSEERGPCMAAVVSSGLLWIPMAALIGRAVDRAVGNAELYRRP